MPNPTSSGRWHRPLLCFAALMALLTLVAVAGLVVDDRTVGGSPAWLKPFKFAVSLGLYAVTLAWLLRHATRLRRTGWWAATVIAFASAGEMAAVTLQAARGRASHFNVATPFDEAVWGVMGPLVVVLWTASLVLAIVVAVQRDTDPVVRTAARAGFALSLAGMLLGFLMTQPTAAQEQVLETGGRATLIGAHSVGVTDGGPSMPVTGWSTTGGDLRIPHFAGIHALQALPLLALVLAAFAGRLPVRTRQRLVRVAALGYSGLVALLTWQALRGQPLLRPDALTLAAAGTLLAVIGVLALFLARTASPADRSSREAGQVRGAKDTAPAAGLAADGASVPGLAAHGATARG